MTFINTYDAGRFAYLMEKPFAAEVWAVSWIGQKPCKNGFCNREGKPGHSPDTCWNRIIGSVAIWPLPKIPRKNIAYHNSISNTSWNNRDTNLSPADSGRNSRYINLGLFRIKPHHAIPYPDENTLGCWGPALPCVVDNLHFFCMEILW